MLTEEACGGINSGSADLQQFYLIAEQFLPALDSLAQAQQAELRNVECAAVWGLVPEYYEYSQFTPTSVQEWTKATSDSFDGLHRCRISATACNAMFFKRIEYLGKDGSDPSVDKLIYIIESCLSPARRRYSLDQQLAAIQALGETRSQRALDLVQERRSYEPLKMFSNSILY